MTSLAEAFRNSSGRKTKWQGQVVHSVVKIDVSDGDVIEIRRRSASGQRAQALKVAADKGGLRANGVLTPIAAIWTHTAPETAILEVSGKRTRSLDVWNSWSYDGVDSSWIGSAGILHDRDGDTHTLRCSDGVGDPAFEDLIVELSVTRRG